MRLSTIGLIVAVLAVSIWVYQSSNLLAPSSPVPLMEQRLRGQVLVLGSGGLIGRALTQRLVADGFDVLEVRNRTHLDLRVPGCLDRFNASKIQYVFFLACEVGGARFLENAASQQAIIENNLKIYQAVLPWLHHHRIPFLFTSSYMQHDPGAYGAIKRLGEAWITAALPAPSAANASMPSSARSPLGRVVRFWNVFGDEPRMGERAHVVNDWMDACARKGVAVSLTTGHERRQFLHARDAARAMELMMQLHDNLPAITDVASGIWVSLRTLATMIEQVAPVPCRIEFGERVAPAREEIRPNLSSALWHHFVPHVALRDGLREVFAHVVQTVNSPPPAT